ncbi:MAG TPA: protein translocase subunit SecD [Rhizomicrobium sp.]|jgi:protein-export membrane protein SecD|nr:protein translocase subunit SecD [Rhizomicrobium sp.]
MLQISTWLRVLIGIVLLGGLLIALPNALPENVRAKMPHFLPSGTVALGLDLQGGSYLLEEVELDQVQKDRIESLMGDIRIGLRKARIGYTNLESRGGDTVSVQILDRARYADAVTILKTLNPTTGGSLLGVGQRAYDFKELGNDTVSMTMTEGYVAEMRQQTVNQSIEVVRRRIDQLGTREPTIERQGQDRILIQVPGLSDPQRLIDMLGKTAKMTFQMVDQNANVEQAKKGVVPIGDELLPMDKPEPGQPNSIVVEKRVVVGGDRLTDAAGTFSQQSGQAIVDFKFDSVGAREFGDATRQNVGRPFAIVLDNKVISAPVIREPILGGQGQIEGNFTIQSASDLAALLRAGALPAPLKVIEQRTVGAELGADSVKAGKYSAIGGLLLVALFMVLRYGLFGLFADVALTLNVVLLFAALTIFGATLTLPGIAGIVLTMGMAVDANVLIYERIKEEQRNGRSMLASIDTGFRRAMATIIDANMTHLIASLILFQLGSGPVRGFAVTLGVGIITSFFTAVMVTRLMVVTWLETRHPKRLAI